MLTMQKFYNNVSKEPIEVETKYLTKSLAGVEDFHKDYLEKLKNCYKCSARNRDYEPVPPAGTKLSPFIFQGRSPGRREAEEGRPFSRRAPGGRILNQYLELLGLERNEVYVTNTLFCYKKEDISPTEREFLICRYWKNVENSFLSNVKFVFLIGNDAFRSVLGWARTSIVEHCGLVFREGGVYYFPIIHPGYLLRKPELRKVMDFHLTEIRDRYINPFRSGSLYLR